MSAVAAQHIESRAGWKTVAISDAAQVVNGGTPNSKVARYWGGDVQWLTPKDMGQMERREIAATPRTISKEGLANSSARLVPANSVILSTRAPIGHLAINTVPMAFNQGCRGIVPGEGLDTTFLYYFLLANKQRLDDLGSGTTFKELSGSNLKSVQLPLPPLEEQKRIVAVLDQTFAALDRARAHVEANLADAQLLYASAVDELMLHHRGGWRTGTVNDLVGEVATGPFGSLLHKSDYVEAGIPIVNPSNIVNGVIEPDWSKTVFAAVAERLQSYRLHEGDLVIGRRGEMGRCAPVPADMEGWLCGTGSFVIRPQPGVSAEFVGYLMRSRAIVDRMSAIASGATMPNLSNRALGQMPFELPDFQAQLAMLDKIKRIEAKANDLRLRFDAKLADIAALRQSLLQKAFAGELT